MRPPEGGTTNPSIELGRTTRRVGQKSAHNGLRISRRERGTRDGFKMSMISREIVGCMRVLACADALPIGPHRFTHLEFNLADLITGNSNLARPHLMLVAEL